MTLHWYDFVIWAVLDIGKATVAIAIIRAGMARRWPFLLAMMLFALAQDSFLIAHRSTADYRAFFYVYWFGDVAQSLFSFGMLWDVTRSIPAIKYLPRHIALTFLTAATIVMVGCATIASLQHAGTPVIAVFALAVHRCTVTAWLAFTITMLGGISILGMGFNAQSLRITSGFVISGIVKMIAAYAETAWPFQGHLVDVLDSLSHSLILAYWTRALLFPEALPRRTAMVNETVQALVKQFVGRIPEKDMLS